MRVLAVLGTATALLAPAPAPRQTCLAARSGIKTGTIMAEFEARQLAAMDRDEPPPFSAGDTVNVACEITEGTTKRIQNYAGVVIKRSGAGLTQTFTVRKMSSGIGVERTFPVYAPSVTKIEVLRRGSVRRSKLYYLRQLTGKSARIKEKIRGLSYVQRQEAAIAEKKAAALQRAKATAPPKNAPAVRVMQLAKALYSKEDYKTFIVGLKGYKDKKVGVDEFARGLAAAGPADKAADLLRALEHFVRAADLQEYRRLLAL